MRRLAVFIATVLAVTSAGADTVWLKTGESIKANKAAYKGDQVEYIVGLTTYRIPAAEVERIERTQSLGVAVSVVGPTTTASSAEISGQTPRVQRSSRQLPMKGGIAIPGGDALLAQILTSGHINNQALTSIEHEGNPSRSAAAYAVAGNYEYGTNGDLDRAVDYTKRAIDFAPANPSLLCWYSSLLLESGNDDEAVQRAESAVKFGPLSPDAQYQLGAAYYVTNRLPEAIAAWKRSLALRPNPQLAQFLAKVQREATVEADFKERDSSHFTVRFEGERAGFNLAGEILRTLERQHSEISRDLNYIPQASITVVLYTEQQFFAATDSPAWSSGINDGKLRIPVKNLSAVTPEFESVLKHELAHSFVHLMTRGNCPAWLNEGVAQLMEGRNPAHYEPGVARLFRQGQAIPLDTLESSFGRLNESEAEVAYAETLVAVSYIQSNYGAGTLRRVLEQLATGQAPEETLRQITGKDYSQLEQELARYLKSKYPAK